jgi:hypothetical protein
MARSLNFIPFVSASAVEDTWAVTESAELASYRAGALDALYARENRLTTYLRESNTVTSTLYRRSPDDSLFLFFTDDAVGPRPLFGAANLLVGVGASVVGLATLPIDRGDTLLAGVRGAFWSLPELVFMNVRKGSYEHER